MKRKILYSSFIAAIIVLRTMIVYAAPVTTTVLVNPTPLPRMAAAKADWEAKWESTLAGAQREGSVSIYALLSAETRKALGAAFKTKYGINLEFTIGTDGEIMQKITQERTANLHLVDVIMLAGAAYVQKLKPMGVVTPLDKRLILPSVIDEKKWLDGKFPWFDKNHTAVAPLAGYFSYILINTEMVKKDEITSYQDLLKPTWRGKIAIFDPTLPSPTQTFVNYVVPRMMGNESGKEYLRALAKQDLNYVKDARLLVEWVAKAKYPVAMGAGAPITLSFLKAGAPISFVRPKEGGLLAGGPNLVSIVAQAPHPNAADIFVNWLLTDQAQEIFAANQQYPSRRIGVPYKGPHPFPVVRPDDKTIESDEAFYVEGQKTVGWAKEIFGPYVR